MSGERVVVGGPYFEDLAVGQVFDRAPAVTVTAGHAAIHGALFGDRLRLALDLELCRAVAGEERLLAHPSLVCNLAIGQTTDASQRVRGNLFYRGLVLRRPVFVGETLRTTTRVAALRQSRGKPGRPATGMAVLEMQTVNERGETVLDFFRCPMLPCRDPGAATGHADSFDAIPAELDMAQVRGAVPSGWRLDVFREAVPGPHFADVAGGTTYVVEGRDTVTGAPEIVRLSLNLASAHTDAAASAYRRRLVVGYHTISMAAAQITRAIPNLVTILAWRSCAHTEPVFEGDVLRSEVTVEARHPLPGGGGLVDLRALVYADRGRDAPQAATDVAVLDWRLIGLMA
jgi:2-methylfumaryl-CoA hydratase